MTEKDLVDRMMSFQWPELYFGPINLWSAPWLGRAYEEFQRNTAPAVPVTLPAQSARTEQIKTLTQHR